MTTMGQRPALLSSGRRNPILAELSFPAVTASPAKGLSP